MAQFNLAPANYAKPPGIDSTLSLVEPNQTGGAKILVASFSGQYPDGSAGARHAHYVSYITMCALHAFGPHAVVLDFTSLDYRWGDGLLRVFQDISQFMDAPAEPRFPVLVTVSERSAGLLSLLGLQEADGNRVCTSVDDAVAKAVKAANDWLSS